MYMCIFIAPLIAKLFPLYIQKIRQGERREGGRGKEERERKRETHTQSEREARGREIEE